MAAQPSPPPPPSRILIIRPSALGDVARSVPLLVSLRDAFPIATIDWLVQDAFIDMVRAHPALTEAIPFPRKDFSRWVRGLKFGKLRAFLRSLHERRYDLVIDAQGLARSGLVTWSTRAPRRLGHADARELGWLGYTERVPRTGVLHTVDQMLTLVEAAGAPPKRDARAMRLYTPSEGAGFAARRGLAKGTYVVLAPTSRWIAKQWPDDRFAQLTERLVAMGKTVVLVGGKSERSQLARCLSLAASSPGVVDLVGETTVAQLMDTLEHASLVVGNDSAALHIATGFARPLVALFGPTRADRVGPYASRGEVLQITQPGDRFHHKDDTLRHMIERISVDQVLQACQRQLQSRPA